MMELMPFILFGLLFVVVVVIMMVIRGRASRAARLQRLVELGFSSTPEQKEMLAEKITKLEIPVDLQGTNLIGALGPAGASLYDLIGAETLSRFLGAGDCGASIVHCRGELCSMSSLDPRMPLDLEKTIPFLRDLVH